MEAIILWHAETRSWFEITGSVDRDGPWLEQYLPGRWLVHKAPLAKVATATRLTGWQGVMWGQVVVEA